MNLQDEADKYYKKIIDRAKEKEIDESLLTTIEIEIAKLCRMIILYCEADGKVTESFQKSMDTCASKILEIEGMEEILNEFNECPEKES